MDQDRLASLLEATLQALQTSQQLNVQLAAQLHHGPAVAQPAPVAAPGRTLGEWLTLHEAELQDRGYKPQTIKNRKAILKHVRTLWGHRPIAEIRPQEVAQALKQFAVKHTSTARRIHFELRSVYAEAVANGWAEHNPAQHIKTPNHKIKRARLSLKTWESMRELAKAGPQRWVESMLLLALITGQRRADLAKMKTADIVTDGLSGITC